MVAEKNYDTSDEPAAARKNVIEVLALQPWKTARLAIARTNLFKCIV
jgi:hypothetical protein